MSAIYNGSASGEDASDQQDKGLSNHGIQDLHKK